MTVEKSMRSMGCSAARQRFGFGYNHNFRHQGRVFHVQTEDSGPPYSYIHTHIFYAGTVIASRKTSYDDPKPGAAANVEALMRSSHREMCQTLSNGNYDDRIAAMAIRPPAARKRRTTSTCLVVAQPAEVGTPTPAKQERHSDRTAHLRCVQDKERSPVASEAALTLAGRASARACLAAIKRRMAGFLGAAVVSLETGGIVEALGSPIDMPTAGSGNAGVLQLKSNLLGKLGLSGSLEDIVINLKETFCVLRPLGDAFFLYVVADSTEGNLAMAQRVAADAGAGFSA